jgi:hypothetical protein
MWGKASQERLVTPASSAALAKTTISVSHVAAAYRLGKYFPLSLVSLRGWQIYASGTRESSTT